MIVKEHFDRFTNEKMEEYVGKLKEEDGFCVKRSLERLTFCNPVNALLVALLVPFRPGLDREVVKKLVFVPRWLVYEFTRIDAMEQMESINFEKSYELALLCASQFLPVTYGFHDLHLPVIMGADFIGPSEELADVFLGELSQRVKHNRRILDILCMKADDIPHQEPEYYSDGMQMRIIREVFLYNKLQLYIAIRNAAKTVKGSA